MFFAEAVEVLLEPLLKGDRQSDHAMSSSLAVVNGDGALAEIQILTKGVSHFNIFLDRCLNLRILVAFLARRWAVPICHHPDDCGRGSRQRQGSDGGFGDVVGVNSIYFVAGHAESA